MVEVAFANENLREVCEKRLAAEAEFGTVAAKALRARLSDVGATETVAELLLGNPVMGTKECIVEFGNGFQLSFVPNHKETPICSDKSVDWSKVTRVRLLRIEVP